LGPEDTERGWHTGQAAGDAAVLSAENAPFAREFEPETPEMENLRPILAQRQTSPPSIWGLADIMDISSCFHILASSTYTSQIDYESRARKQENSTKQTSMQSSIINTVQL